MSLLQDVDLMSFKNDYNTNLQTGISNHIDMFFLLYDAYDSNKRDLKNMNISRLMKRYGSGVQDTENLVDILASRKKVSDITMSEIAELQSFLSNAKNVSVFYKDIDNQIKFLEDKSNRTVDFMKLFSYLKQTPNNEIEKLKYIKSLKGKTK